MTKATMKANIVGSTFYKDAGNIIARLRPGAKLILRREPNNKYDRNAISVWFSFSGNETQLGHLSRGLAELMAPKLDAGLEVIATKAPIIGGVINLQWEQEEAPGEEVPQETDDALTKRFRGLIT
jgi:hypothetical protein